MRVLLAAILVGATVLRPSVARASLGEAEKSVSVDDKKKKPVSRTAVQSKKSDLKNIPESASEKGSQLETFRDIIEKAQNLTLQRDRLQASQVLIRAVQREVRTGIGYRELTKALDELTSVFYTEKAQTAFVTGEAAVEARPKEALEQFQEALRLEDGNVTILKAIARTHLSLSDCARADASVKSAEALNPYSSEVKLLRLQVLECSKSFELVGVRLSSNDPELETLSKSLFSLRLRDQLRQGDLKKARATLGTWETQMADYPEVFFWKWELGRQGGTPDRAAALKYVQLCQNLTPRKRKSYILDVDLCKGKGAVETYLKESALQPGVPPEDPSND